MTPVVLTKENIAVLHSQLIVKKPRDAFLSGMGTLEGFEKNLGNCVMFLAFSWGICWLTQIQDKTYEAHFFCWGSGIFASIPKIRSLIGEVIKLSSCDRVFAQVDARSHGLARIMLRLGFSYEGRARRGIRYFDGSFTDGDVYARVKADEEEAK